MDETEACTAHQTELKQFIEAEKGRLLPILCLYVVRAQLATLERAANTMASELLDELTAEALKHADQFDPSRQPFAWLLGIASSLVQRRQGGRGKHAGPAKEPVLSDDEVIDRLPQLVSGDLAQQDEPGGIPQEDRRILHLAVQHNLNGETLAQELGMPPGAARVRLHRALDHLRSSVQE